jgi:Leucine-rich repeat (LRR) protein
MHGKNNAFSFSLVISVFMLCSILLHCGKEEEKNLAGVVIKDKYAEDTAVVRMILDTNGITDVSVRTVSTMVLVDTLVGDNRIEKLTIIPSRLDGRQISFIPEGLGQLSRLSSLRLDNNNLSSLPPDMWQCTTLTSLFLRENNLTTLSDSIGNCTSLSTVDIAFNKLRSLPQEIANLEEDNISLYLNDNELTTLPSSMTTMSSVIWCDIENNRLCNLSTELKTWIDNINGKDPDHYFHATWEEEYTQRCN